MRKKEVAHMEKYIALMEKARAWIDAHRDEFIAELQAWARIPSVSRVDLAAPGMPFGPDCRKMLDFAMERGRHYGFDVTEHDGCACSITWGDGEDSIGVIAHLDVVPVGEGWVYPPFGATYLPEHDVMIGRGVDDNKGSAIAGLFAMRMLREFGWPMRHGIRLMCGTSEETGMQDMQRLKEQGLRFPKVSLVPDAGFPVNFGQKGSVDATLHFPCEGNLLRLDAGSVRNIIPDLAQCVVDMPVAEVQQAFATLDAELMAHLTVEACPEGTAIAASGRSGHAAFPAGGDNAISHLTRALAESGVLQGSYAETIRAVADLTADAYGRSEGVAYSDEISGELTLVYGVAHLQNGVLKLNVDCRYPITCQGDALEAALRQDWVRRGGSVAAFERSEPFYIPKDDPYVVALQAVYKAATGRDDEPYTMGGGTYSRVVPNAISFGPGMPGTRHDWSAFLPEGHGGAHGRDETIPMQKLYDCCCIYVAALAALDELVPS